MNIDLKNEFKLTNDGDNWGNVMQWLFAIADYLTFETKECVPDAWQFRPSPLGADEESYVFQALKDLALPSVGYGLQFTPLGILRSTKMTN